EDELTPARLAGRGSGQRGHPGCEGEELEQERQAAGRPAPLAASGHLLIEAAPEEGGGGRPAARLAAQRMDDQDGHRQREQRQGPGLAEAQLRIPASRRVTSATRSSGSSVVTRR